MKVLEVGAGFGWLLDKLAGEGSGCFGTEIVAEPFHGIAQSLRCRCLLAEGQRLPFADGSFDLVISMEVIEHTREPRLIVAELARVSRQYVLVSCPNYLNLYFFVRLAAALGLSPAARYINLQVIDRWTTSVHLRRLVTSTPSLRIVAQRAARLAPPLFEKLDRAGLRKINDSIFRIEAKYGARRPLNFMGLHTVCLARKLA